MDEGELFLVYMRRFPGLLWSKLCRALQEFLSPRLAMAVVRRVASEIGVPHYIMFISADVRDEQHARKLASRHGKRSKGRWKPAIIKWLE